MGYVTIRETTASFRSGPCDIRLKTLVGAAGLEPATLGLEGSAGHFLGFTLVHTFHSVTPIPGICFRSE